MSKIKRFQFTTKHSKRRVLQECPIGLKMSQMKDDKMVKFIIRSVECNILGADGRRIVNLIGKVVE